MTDFILGVISAWLIELKQARPSRLGLGRWYQKAQR